MDVLGADVLVTDVCMVQPLAAARLLQTLLCCCWSACPARTKGFQQTHANAQAYITYGRQGNDRLLQFYGFVEADNPADTYVVSNLEAAIEVTTSHGF